MYDITIRDDGCPVLENGDFVPVSYEQFVGQKIYNALMNMNVALITSVPVNKLNKVEAHIKDYMNAFFVGDLDIDPIHISIKVTPFPGNEKIGFTLSYKGTSPSGEEIDYQSQLSYSLSAGAVLHTHFEPAWLCSRDTYYEKDIVLPVKVRMVSDRIEIPLEPVPVDGPIESGPALYGSLIYLVMEHQAETCATITEDSFEIELYTGRSKYPLFSYVPGHKRRETVIDSYAFTDTLQAPDFYVITEHGEPVIVVDKGSTGFIRGTAYLRHAVQVTHIYTVAHEMVASPLYPLRRRRGKYFAIFPKTIQIGDYFIIYKGLSEVR